MTEQSIKAEQALIQQLREVAETETAWLEKNRLLYTEKRSRLDSLIELRSASGGEVTPENKSFVSTLPYMNLDDQGFGKRDKSGKAELGDSEVWRIVIL